MEDKKEILNNEFWAPHIGCGDKNLFNRLATRFYLQAYIDFSFGSDLQPRKEAIERLKTAIITELDRELLK